MKIREVLNLILLLCQILELETLVKYELIETIHIYFNEDKISLRNQDGYDIFLSGHALCLKHKDINFDGENFKSEHLYFFIEKILDDIIKNFKSYRYKDYFDINELLMAVEPCKNSIHYIKLKKLALLQ